MEQCKVIIPSNKAFVFAAESVFKQGGMTQQDFFKVLDNYLGAERQLFHFEVISLESYADALRFWKQKRGWEI